MEFRKTSRGGRRAGSGRPPGSGKSSEDSKVVRIPQGAQAQVMDFLAAYRSRRAAAPAGGSAGSGSYPDDAQFPVVDPPPFDLPLYAYAVPAGLPAAAEDAVDRRIDLNQFLIRNPAATFYFRVSGDSMNQAGILDGMVAAVDCSRLPRNRDPVLAVVNGEFTVKRYVKSKTGFELHPDSDNPKHQPIVPVRGQVVEVRGVIVGTVQKFN
jgi:DNA polymerase V